MRLPKRFVVRTTGAVFVGSVVLSLAVPSALAGPSSSPSGMTRHVKTGPTGNKVEMVPPSRSTYIPDVAGASAADRARAQRLLDGVNKFCHTHTAAGIRKYWRPGTSRPTHHTHYFNPRPPAQGLNPAKPAAALIYGGKLGGVMFNGMPLPHLGSIPRAHTDASMMDMEMVHVYCTPSLKEAFTPNRLLGVKAALIRLRLTIRPAIMDLNKSQLGSVRHKVRGDAGDRLSPVKPVGHAGPGRPDPVLQARRTEIRQALMILTEHQLRSVWALMRSY